MKQTITLSLAGAATAAAVFGIAGAQTPLRQNVASAMIAPSTVPGRSGLVFLGTDGKLVYKPWDKQGDTILDFSNCGYEGGGVSLPTVPARATLSPAAGEGDDTPRIQAAIDTVAKKPTGASGFRGAVLLKRGKYRIGASLKIATSGIVLRGEGSGENGTLLYANRRKSYSIIEVGGTAGVEAKPNVSRKITDNYVPVGARSFTIENAAGFKSGDLVLVRRIGNADWIHFIGMDRITPRKSDPTSTKQWKPFDLNFERVITSIKENRLTVDAPIACAIDTQWGGGTITPAADSKRIEKIGIENLRGECVYDSGKKAKESGKAYLSDEAHATDLVNFRFVKNAWAKDLASRYLLHGIATIGRGAKWVTVQDSSSIDPVSIITGGRRYPFNISGQLCLVQRCYARDARHAFTVGGGAVCGPNAFVDCKAEQNHATSEPHQRWSVGGLYDNVDAAMAFQDRQWMGTGHGWAGANYVVWNSRGSVVSQQPPTAENFVIGFVGTKSKAAFPRPDGWWESVGTPVTPQSLYKKQLADRLGPQAVKNIAPPLPQ